MTVKKIRFTDKDIIESVKEFVSIVSKSSCDVDIVSGRYVVDAKSIMGWFSLDLSSELVLMIHCEEAECAELVTELSKFILAE